MVGLPHCDYLGIYFFPPHYTISGVLLYFISHGILQGFLCGSAGKESVCDVGDLGLIPVLGKSPGEGNGNPLQYSCPENPIHRGAWRGTVHSITKSQAGLSDWIELRMNIRKNRKFINMWKFRNSLLNNQ